MSEPRLVAQEDGLWVFDKPAGWVVHRTADASDPDVLRWAQATFDLPKDFGALHRIDKGTSGLLVFAVGRKVRAHYSRFFADGQVEKEYQALVYGQTEPRFVVDRPLHDGRRERKLDAETHFVRLRAYRLLTYLRARPKTGRKHQIRRHLRGMGHPIVGDVRYGPRYPRPVPGFPGRMWLHNCRIAFPNGKTFELALPEALKAHLKLLDSIDGVAGDEEHPG